MTQMKLVTLYLLIASTMFASGLMAPDTTHDGIALDPTAPGIGALIVAIPGSSWLWGWNEGSDFDFDDAYGSAVFGPQVGLFVPMTLSYTAALSDDTDNIRLGFGGSWLSLGQTATYTVLANLPTIESMKDVSTGTTYYSGPGIGNPSGQAAMWTQMVPPDCAPVPEPGTVILIGLGLVGLGVVRRRKHA